MTLQKMCITLCKGETRGEKCRKLKIKKGDERNDEHQTGRK